MRNVFKLEAWKIFVFIILPILFPENMFGFMLTLVFVLMFGAWAYFLGEALHLKLPGGHNLNLNKFKIFLIIPGVYFLGSTPNLMEI